MARESLDIPHSMRKVYRRFERWRSAHTARLPWWIGLRDVENEHYTGPGRDFQRDEGFFRLGFQAALQARTRGKEYDQVLNEMTEDLGELSVSLHDST